jgi:hypothetical protein
MVMVQFIKDTKITKPPTKTAAAAPQKSYYPGGGAEFRALALLLSLNVQRTATDEASGQGLAP